MPKYTQGHTHADTPTPTYTYTGICLMAILACESLHVCTVVVFHASHIYIYTFSFIHSYKWQGRQKHMQTHPHIHPKDDKTEIHLCLLQFPLQDSHFFSEPPSLLLVALCFCGNLQFFFWGNQQNSDKNLSRSTGMIPKWWKHEQDPASSRHLLHV